MTPAATNGGDKVPQHPAERDEDEEERFQPNLNEEDDHSEDIRESRIHREVESAIQQTKIIQPDAGFKRGKATTACSSTSNLPIRAIR
ncbi:hypothetical protein VZT92_019279 [Zoarces viviparus]|uniref:Uncharacterized protein n=1 Tax=Zoarces viviparus TaxID=48416 RepID=A0AAW1EKQ2_ZOAVI